MIRIKYLYFFSCALYYAIYSSSKNYYKYYKIFNSFTYRKMYLLNSGAEGMGVGGGGHLLKNSQVVVLVLKCSKSPHIFFFWVNSNNY